MWVAKFSLIHEDCLITPRCIKFKINDSIYPITSYKQDGKYYYVLAHYLQGEPENKRKFINSLKKEKTVKKIIKNHNIYLILVEHETLNMGYRYFFNPSFIHIKPVLHRMNREEKWEVASWDKESLNKLVAWAMQTQKATLHKFEKRNDFDFYIPRVFPQLSPKQKLAMYIACENGYYTYPRRKSINELADIMGVSPPTFQEHIRKAEIKLLPFIFDEVNQ